MAREAERIWSRCVGTEDPDSCWEWQGSLTGPPRKSDGKRYGKVQAFGRLMRAHVAAWVVANGPVPDGQHVRHLVCDNPPCCNPRHLAVGSRQENMDDMVRAGRSTRGERNPSALLTNDEVLRIRDRRAQGATLSCLGAEFGVSFQTISDVCRGKRWGWL